MADDLKRRDLLSRTVSGDTGTDTYRIDSDGRPDAQPPEEHIIGFEPQGDAAMARSLSTKVKKAIDFGNIGRAVVGRFSDQALQQLRDRQDVRYVEKDQPVVGLAETLPWGIDRIDADDAQADGDSATGVDVAILDTGIDSDHPDLDANLGTGNGIINCGTKADGSPCSSISGSCDQNWDDDEGHGTHVAGTVGADDNTEGVIGAAPTATLHAVKVLDCANSGTGSDLADGLKYVADQGWDVANMSLGFGFDANGNPNTNSIITDAVDYAAARDVLMIAAAGNDGESSVCDDGQCVQYPAKYSEVIAVSALMKDDTLAPYSNRGSEIELSAPGGGDADGDGNECPSEMIYSTVPTETTFNGTTYSYLCKNGTSMASPHVAGSAALAVGSASLSNSQGVRDKLNSTAVDVGLSSDRQGNGRVDAADATPTPAVGEWSFDAGSRLQYSSVAVSGSRVFVGGLGSTLYGLNRSDGSVDWQYSRSGSLADSSPVLSGGRLFVGSGGGAVYALDPTDGSKFWEYSIGSAHVSTPTVAGSTVYIGSNDGTVLALDESNGTKQWETDVGGAVLSRPAVDSGVVYTTTDDGDVVALDDSASGSELWRFSTDAELGHSSPTVANNRVYVAADQVYALDRSNGTEDWSTTYGGTAGSSPVYDSNSGLVFVGDATDSVYALDDSNSGTVTWSFSTGGTVGATPTVTGSGVLVGSDDGTLYLLDTTNGRVQDTLAVAKTRSTPLVDGDATFVTTWSGTVEKKRTLLG